MTLHPTLTPNPWVKSNSAVEQQVLKVKGNQLYDLDCKPDVTWDIWFWGMPWLREPEPQKYVELKDPGIRCMDFGPMWYAFGGIQVGFRAGFMVSGFGFKVGGVRGLRIGVLRFRFLSRVHKN